MTVRFIHTGDLHLDSPFAGLVTAAPDHVAAALREATIQAWNAIVDLALEERVDFLVVAGDVFDRESRTLRGQVRFRDGLARLSAAGIPSFVVAGNHDPQSSWERAVQVAWPPLAHFFGSRQVTGVAVRRGAAVDGDGEEIARVYGISFGQADVRENLARRFRREPGVPVAVGLLHANVGQDTGHDPYAPCTLEDLRAADMDYWALGHVHRRGVLSVANPAAVYCGNPQGRDPNEGDPRGCYLVTIHDRGRITPEFMPVDVVRWQHVTVDLSGFEEIEPLIDRVAEAVDAARTAAGRSVIARVELAGRGPLRAVLVRGGAVGDLRDEAQSRLGEGSPWAWIESLRDRTRPDIDIAERRDAPDFLGEVLREFRRVREAIAAPDPTEPRAALNAVLDELYEHGRARRFLRDARPEGDRLLECLDEAERLVLDRLGEAG
jgi:DNA repair exonuclease SbcCD nuclease subunit